MTVDPTVVPGLLLLAGELIALAAVGYVVARVVLRQDDERTALAQGLVVGLALWGVIVNFVMYLVPGLGGAIVGWSVTLTAGAILAWRAPHPIGPRPRVAAGFVVAALALMWIALASRQLLTIPDWEIHLGLSAVMRAGAGFPPELPWNPGIPVSYHYGFDLLVGLLAPPFGPDLAFTTELLGVYIWTALALIVVTTLIQRGSALGAVLLAPLLLTAGAWTVVFVPPPDVLLVPVPAGIPSAGIRASLTDLYWPSVQLPWLWPGLASEGLSTPSPPNLFKPYFPLAYAPALVVLERAASPAGRWPGRSVVLALLVGFVSLSDEAVAPIVLVLWVVFEAMAFWKARQPGADTTGLALRAAAGPALAMLLLVLSGGALTGVLTDAGGSGLSLGWIDDASARRPIATFAQQPGGLGLLGLGPLVVAAAAALLAWRDRLVLALIAGALVFLLAALTLQYEFSPDVARLDGHARNFALLALLVALSMRLAGLRPRWRTAAGALLVGLVIWPTVAAPARNLGLAVGQGVQFANEPTDKREFNVIPMDRYEIKRFESKRIAAFIRDHTAVDARILTTSPLEMTLATGRPNSLGFVGVSHLVAFSGPDYADARRSLEPTAIRRLGIDYLVVPGAWMAELPARAQRWLANPELFEPLVRDGDATLYRVRPAFLQLDAPPTPGSFAHLRSSVPPATTVYLPPQLHWLTRLRVASVLPHAQLLGTVHGWLHRRMPAPWSAEPLGDRAPDLIVLPATVEPWMLPPAGRRPVWHNHEIAVYAPNGAIAPIVPPPARPDPPVVDVRLSDARAADGRLTFTGTFDNRTPEQWTSQDWIMFAVDDTPWNIPLAFGPAGRMPEVAAWFDGWLGPGATTTTHTYEFDPRASRLAIRDSEGDFTAAAASGDVPGPGVWTLALRLRHEYQSSQWRDAAVIPVLRIKISQGGEVAYEVVDAARDGRPLPSAAAMP
ncbi:MAG: hypothetical protein OXG33_03180 [Chloroflexi bacterium]|nr:hypothetical protein [Chloroflexota bacterium]